MADTDMTFRTWCIGRYLVELPDSFEPLENYGQINAMRVEDLGPGDARRMETMVRQRAHDLSTGAVDVEGVPLVFRGAYRKGAIHVLAHELDLGQEPGTSFTWTEEAYVLRDGVILRVVQVLSEDDEAGPRAQMLDLAAKVLPSRRDDPAGAAGACLPEVLATMPMTSEVHGMTLVPRDAEGAPVGIEILIVSRSPEDPPLEPELPSGPTARPIEFAGLQGMEVDDPVNFGPSRLAVVGRAASADRPALRIQVYYYDERPASEAPPDAPEVARTVFERAIRSLRQRGPAE